VEKLSAFSSATLYEAQGQTGALSSGIKPLDVRMKVCGPAFTISSPPRDNLMLHQALTLVQPGDVLVVEVSGWYEAGYWGDILTRAAMEKQVAGLVIDGCVRDRNEIVDLGFPVFSRGVCIRGTAKEGGGYFNHRIKLGDVFVEPGDIVLGDADGVVVVSQSNIHVVLEQARMREEKEDHVRAELKKGRSTMDIYGWS
jgi:4-hydroxy-4-methyl-2-oxoglutarate aldolase